MDGYQRQQPPVAKSHRLPIWVWVLTVIGIIVAITNGYNTGKDLKYIISHITITDTNGAQDKSLTKLNFKNFINKNDSDSYYNELDHTGLFALGYNSNASDSASKTYNNDYTASVAVDLQVSFRHLVYYDICYVNKNTTGKTSLNYDVRINITSGNMEAAILEVDRDYKCVTRNGESFIDQQYVTEVKRIKADGERTGTVPLKADKIYIIAFAGENADGGYTLSVTLQ